MVETLFCPWFKQVKILGTSHVVAIDHEGNAVSATSSINQLLY